MGVRWPVQYVTIGVLSPAAGGGKGGNQPIPLSVLIMLR